MAVQKGIVSKIEESRVWVMALSEKNEESGCASEGCGSGCSCNVTGQVFRAENVKDLPLEEGDKVQVRADTSALGLGFFLVILLPLLTALGFWYGIPLLLNRDASTWMAVAGAAVGLAAGLLLGNKDKKLPFVEQVY